MNQYASRLYAIGIATLLLLPIGCATREPAESPDLTGIWIAEDPPIRAAGRSRDAGAREVYLNVPGLDPDSPNVFKEMDALAVALRAKNPNTPVYRPELQAKVKELSDLQAKLDPAFYCRPPGVPRIGPPNQIVQSRDVVVFLYANQNVFRVIPTGGRPPRTDVEPSYMGESVGRWEGDTLVVETTRFTEDTWLGSDGYFHSPAMRVIERFERSGTTLGYSVTVEDPEVLAQPWDTAPRILYLSTNPADMLVESPPCIERSAPHMLTNEHH